MNRLSQDILSRIASSARSARQDFLFPSSSIDEKELASSILRRVASARKAVTDEQITPTNVLASRITRRLISARIFASEGELYRLERTLASTIAHSFAGQGTELQPEQIDVKAAMKPMKKPPEKKPTS